MYWFKKSLLISLVASTLATSCESPHSNAKADASLSEIQKFLREEVDSLQSQKPTIKKTIGFDKEQESKDVEVENWENELGFFLSIDLAKPVYAGNYKIDSVGRNVKYEAKTSDIDIRSIQVVKDQNGSIVRLEIIKNTDNILYDNKEKLVYEKGKLYSLDKEQDIVLIGKKKYHIRGEF